MSKWRRFTRRTSARVGVIVVLVFLGVAALAPWLAPYSYRAQDLNRILLPPCRAHPLGTDEFGRDILSRIIWGTRISLAVGAIAVGIGATVGTALGAVAGYWGGWAGMLIVGLVDVMWSFPTILLAIGLVAVLRPGLTSAMIALGLVTWPQYARVMRAQVLSLREKEFVEAARSLGASDGMVLLRHIVPNAISPNVVLATMGMASAILVESALSYLGLGAQPPAPSWGAMLSEGRNFIYRAPWMTLAPGLAIVVVVLGFNLCGDALRDALDPYRDA
ncbi:MAG: ABC transporter permease [Bacillota bacterium]|nr:ABC transporter permease [Bacillota bacterium]